MCIPGGDAFEVQNAAISTARSPQAWFYDWATGGGGSDAGVAVTGYTALTHCPLWQGVNIIAGDIGQVPIRLVKDTFDEQRKHPAWNLLRVAPNAMQTPSVWKETMIQWALIWGNGVSWIPRRGARPEELIPLRPDCLRPEVIEYGNKPVILYHYDSPATGKQYVFNQDEVIHIQGLTGDGIWGYPLFQIARNTIGHGLALEKHGNKNFANGARPSGVLEHPAKLSPEAVANLRREWDAVHSGSNNSGKIAILWEAMKFNPISMTNIDAQWLDAKKLNRVDCASLLNLPAHKLNALEDSSVRSNLEEQNEVYKQMTLTRWSNRMNDEFKRKLLTVSEWQSDQFEFVFDFDAFLRADIDTLTQVGDRCVKAEIMNRNEARLLIRLPPYPDGEKFGSPAINPAEGQNPEALTAKAIGDILQSLYLAVVNGVISPNEARAIARQAGADLPDLPGDAGEVQYKEERVETTPEPAKTEPQNRSFDVQAAHRELMYDHILSFVEAESNYLTRAASRAKNFTAWLDEFYLGNAEQPAKIQELSDTIMGSSVKACLAAGFDARGVANTVAKYAKQRHKLCLEACGNVTQEELPATIKTLVGSNKSLVAQGLLATALGGQTWDSN
jgi:HK97 family phage portal protein